MLFHVIYVLHFFKPKALELKTLYSEPVQLIADDDLMIGNKVIVWDKNTVIDDILLWCNNKNLHLFYFVTFVFVSEI